MKKLGWFLFVLSLVGLYALTGTGDHDMEVERIKALDQIDAGEPMAGDYDYYAGNVISPMVVEATIPAASPTPIPVIKADPPLKRRVERSNVSSHYRRRNAR